VPDRLDGLAAELSHALRDDIRRAEDLRRLIVEQQVVIAKMRTRHVPMKVLGFEIEREHVGQQCIERCGNIAPVRALRRRWCSAWLYVVIVDAPGA